MANQTQILNVSDEMKFDDNVQTDNVKEQEENMYSSSSDTTEELCSFRATDTCGNSMLAKPHKISIFNVLQRWKMSDCRQFATIILKNDMKHRKGTEPVELLADSVPFYVYEVFTLVACSKMSTDRSIIVSVSCTYVCKVVSILVCPKRV